ARLVDTAEVSATPLEDRLERLGRRLIWITLAIAGVTTVLGIAGGRGLLLMIETGLALAVAAIPEGLPIVATIALARGMWRMAARRALINRLAAVETLGATTLILTDKTGTLTENRMALRRIELADGSVAVMGEGLSTEGRLEIDGKPVEPVAGTPLRALLETAVLCSNATLRLDGARVVGALGDPMEVAFLLAGLRAGIDRSRLLTERPEEHETAFDRATRMMATYHRLPGSGFEVAVKGAPEAVLEACTRQLAKDGERP
ncbi:MAG: cation-transporting P-type ATPase, partial [Acidobacteria bacterium]|nr:cation-transporting P-type ATPase [Acidobacteriota bacterium]